MTIDTPGLAALIVTGYRSGHQRILEFATRLTEEQLQWRPTLDAPPIAFHLWHVARWADYTNAVIPGMTPELGRLLAPNHQVWEAEQLAERWGFAAQLGYRQTGMQMDEAVAQKLSFPAKADVLDYVQKAFEAVDRTVALIPADQLLAREQLQPLTEGIWGESTVGDAILTHIIHDNRHLGMMECLLGIQTGVGSATV